MMRGSYAERKAELEHVSSLWGPPATVSEIRVLKTELPLTAGLQANHDNESWTWEVNNHRLAESRAHGVFWGDSTAGERK